MSEVAHPPVVIPSTSNADELAQMDMLLALDRVQHCQEAVAAKVYVERALSTGLPHYKFSEVIRAVEHRLPEATQEQIEYISLIREKATGIISLGRCLGAFGDSVLVLLGNREKGLPFKVVLMDVPYNTEICIPSWDVNCPIPRRTWKPAQEVTAND